MQVFEFSVWANVHVFSPLGGFHLFVNTTVLPVICRVFAKKKNRLLCNWIRCLDSLTTFYLECSHPDLQRKDGTEFLRISTAYQKILNKRLVNSVPGGTARSQSPYVRAYPGNYHSSNQESMVCSTRSSRMVVQKHGQTLQHFKITSWLLFQFLYSKSTMSCNSPEEGLYQQK